MSVHNWDNRASKDIIRDYVTLNRVSRSGSLWIPGADCLCLKKALKHGTITHDSRIIVVERDSKIAAKMKDTLARMDMTNVVIAVSELYDVHIPFNLDYVYADMCGVFSNKLARWITEELQNKLLPDSLVFFTHAYGFRDSPYMKQASSLLKTKEARELAIRIQERKPNILLLKLLLKNLFNQHTFDLGQCIKYKDSINSMMLLEALNFRRNTVMLKNTIMIDFVAKRSAAAHKAVATRRANALAKKLSEAALKAWETRRTNTRAKKLSEAAHKAWATRRANGWTSKKAS